MKSIALVLIFLFNFYISFAEIDTLNHFRGQESHLYQEKNIVGYIERFDIKSDSQILGLKLSFISNTNKGKFDLKIFDKQNDMPVPTGNAIYEEKDISIDTTGKVIIEKVFKSPLNVGDNQFFICVENISEEVKLITDKIEKKVYCEDKGLQYSSQVIKLQDGDYKLCKYAFDIQVYVEQTKKQKKLFNMIGFDSVFVNKENSNQNISTNDIDGDGKVDLLYDGRLLMNKGDFKFEDKTLEFGFELSPKLNIALDIDCNGILDLLYFSLADTIQGHKSILYYQTKSNFQAKEVNLPKLENPTSFSIADVNKDGYPDVVIVQSQKTDSLLQDYLLMSNKKSFESGEYNYEVIELAQTNSSNNKTVELIDYDKDGDIDILTSDGISILTIENDGGRVQNKLIKVYELANNTEKSYNSERIFGFQFTKNSDELVVINNLEFDLLNTNIKQTLFKPENNNLNNSNYNIAGYGNYAESLIKDNIVDYYNMSSESGYLLNDTNSNTLIFKNNICTQTQIFTEQDGQFERITEEYYVKDLFAGRDGILADLNSDGKLDLITIMFDYIIIYKNINEEVQNNFLEIDISKLKKESYNQSEVEVYTDKGIFRQTISNGRGYLKQSPMIFHFGLQDSKQVDSVMFITPLEDNTKTQKRIIKEVSINTKLQIEEKDGIIKIENNNHKIQVINNPFIENTRFDYIINKGCQVSCEIFTMEGSIVKEFKRKNMNSGTHQIHWDGRDRNGMTVPSGVYIIKLRIGNETLTERVVKIG